MENFEHDFSLEGKGVVGDFRFGLLHQDKRASRTTNYKTLGDKYQDYGTQWHITFTNLWGSHNWLLDNGIKLNSLIYYRDATVADDTIGYIDTIADKQVGYYRPNSQIGIEEKIEYTPDENLDLLVGVNWEQETLATGFSTSTSSSITITPAAPTEPANTATSLMSLFAQAQYYLSSDVSVSLGVRNDNSSSYDRVTTPRAALIYNSGKATSKLMVAEAFRAPKPWDINNSAGSLSPEIINSTEFYWGYNLSQHSKVSSALYHNVISDRLSQDNSGKWINSGKQIVNGLELSWDYSKDRLNAYANYTYTDAKDQNGDRVDEIAPQTLNAAMVWPLSDSLEIDLRAQHLGKRPNPQVITTTGESSVDSATLLHTALNWHQGDLHLQFAINNVFDENYYHTSNRPPERYRQPQRQLMLTVRYHY